MLLIDLDVLDAIQIQTGQSSVSVVSLTEEEFEQEILDAQGYEVIEEEESQPSVKKSTTVTELTLPELSDTLALVKAEGKPMIKLLIEFIRLHAFHLLTLCESPTKGMYDIYCEKIVNEYPEFADDGGKGSILTWVRVNFVIGLNSIKTNLVMHLI